MVEWSKDIYKNPHAPKLEPDQMASLNIIVKEATDTILDSSDIEDATIEGSTRYI